MKWEIRWYLPDDFVVEESLLNIMIDKVVDRMNKKVAKYGVKAWTQKIEEEFNIQVLNMIYEIVNNNILNSKKVVRVDLCKEVDILIISVSIT